MRQNIKYFIAALTLFGASAAHCNNRDFTIEKVTVTENPQGLGFGFWCNGKMSDKMMLDFGRRPYERYGFFSWKSLEATKGVYNTQPIIDGVRTVHALGSTCVISLNNISGPWFNKAKSSQIPDFYPQDITNNETREAGKKYIYEIIKAILPRTGDLIVCFDYEMMWHCRPDTPQKQKMLRDWFIDAAKEARRAAHDIGMDSALKIIPIVNGAIDDSATSKLLNSVAKNHVPAQWLLDIVSVCDYLAIDSYDFDINDPTNPDKTLTTLSFWINNYSQGKPVHITEFGYSTANSYFPDYRTHYHATGTEEQQAAFYKALLPLMTKENVVGGRLNGQVRSFCFWMYSDIKTKKEASERENHFGIKRLDGTKKPSFKVLTDGMNSIENNRQTAPSHETKRQELTDKLIESGVVTQFISGTSFDYIELTPMQSATKGKVTITLSLTNAGTVLLNQGDQWQHALEERKTHELTVDMTDKSPIKIFLTGGKYPFAQTIKKLTIK